MIDLRSDTVTKPNDAMRQSMAQAEVGDDVYGEDPTVNQLETLCADRLAKEAAIFCASGTQSNLLALMSHCRRGDEYIVGQQAHTYRYEAGGAAVLGSIQPQPLDHENATHLKAGLADIKELEISPDSAQTNMVFVSTLGRGAGLPLFMEERGILISEEDHLRLVTHLDISADDIARVIDAFKAFFS